MKEGSMNGKFKISFENALIKLSKGLLKKSGIKKKEIINQKIGKLQQKYPSITLHYDIELLVDEKTNKVTSINWKAKESQESQESQENQEKEQGVYL